MITIQGVTSMGVFFRIEVQQVGFVRNCPHCDVEFMTVDPDQIYPTASHKARAYEMRTILKQSLVTL